jgi:hypothetical protein
MRRQKESPLNIWGIGCCTPLPTVYISPMTQSPRQQSSAWRIERLIQGTRRIAETRRSPPASTVPPAQSRQQQDAALAILNAGIKAHGLDPLTALPERGPEQPQAQKIDPKTLAAQIVHFGRVARGGLPPPLPPKDSLAYQILRAGAIARNEPFPE